MKKPEAEVFFHLGLGKTATTYLQYEFFPKLRGVRYVQRTRYRDFDSIYQNEDVEKFFVSREFDQQLEREVKKFAPKYPEARVIIIFRRHDGWIASQYRRWVKNGFGGSFSEFYDATNNNGLWKHHELDYMAKLKILETHFKHKPLVLFYEDLKRYPYEFFDAFAQYLQVSYRKYDISLDPTHTSYSEKQLKVMRKVGKRLLKQNPKMSEIRILRWLQRRSRLLLCYIVLYPSALLPDEWFDKEPLIEPEELEKVRIRFASDWQLVHDYANHNNWQDVIGALNPSVLRLGKISTKTGSLL